MKFNYYTWLLALLEALIGALLILILSGLIVGLGAYFNFVVIWLAIAIIYFLFKIISLED